MNKKNLRNKYVVILRKGTKLLLVDDFLYDNNFAPQTSLDRYNENLTHKFNFDYDIMVIKNTLNQILWMRTEQDWSKIKVGMSVLVKDKNSVDEYQKAKFIKKTNHDKFLVLMDEDNDIKCFDICIVENVKNEKLKFEEILDYIENKCLEIRTNKGCQKCKYWDNPFCDLRLIYDNFNISRKEE